MKQLLRAMRRQAAKDARRQVLELVGEAWGENPDELDIVNGVVKRVFGFAKVRNRELTKNGNRMFVTSALANIFSGTTHALGSAPSAVGNRGRIALIFRRNRRENTGGGHGNAAAPAFRPTGQSAPRARRQTSFRSAR